MECRHLDARPAEPDEEEADVEQLHAASGGGVHAECATQLDERADHASEARPARVEQVPGRGRGRGAASE